MGPERGSLGGGVAGPADPGPQAACGARLWLGRQVRDMPVVAAAWEAGEIDAAHVRRLAGARNHRTAEAFARDEAFLVAKAQELTFESPRVCWRLD